MTNKLQFKKIMSVFTVYSFVWLAQNDINYHKRKINKSEPTILLLKRQKYGTSYYLSRLY